MTNMKQHSGWMGTLLQHLQETCLFFGTHYYCYIVLESGEQVHVLKYILNDDVEAWRLWFVIDHIKTQKFHFLVFKQKNYRTIFSNCRWNENLWQRLWTQHSIFSKWCVMDMPKYVCKQVSFADSAFIVKNQFQILFLYAEELFTAKPSNERNFLACRDKCTERSWPWCQWQRHTFRKTWKKNFYLLKYLLNQRG